MKRVVDIEMATNWVSVESNEDHVDVIANQIDVLVEIQHIFVELDQARLHWLAIDVVNLVQVFFDNEGWIRQHVENERGLGVAQVGLDPEIARW
jgi:hypothetical protein